MHTHIYIPIYLYIYIPIPIYLYIHTIHTHTHTPANRYTYICIPIRLALLAACETQTYCLKTRHTPKCSSLTAPESRLQSASHRALTSCLCANSQQAAFFFLSPFTAPLRCARARSRQTFCFILYVILFFPFSFLARLRCARTRSRQPSFSSPSVSRMHVFYPAVSWMHVFYIHLCVHSTANRAARPS